MRNSGPLAVFTSAYAHQEMRCYDAYEETFLDVFLTNSHPSVVEDATAQTEDGQIVAQLHFRLNQQDEKTLLVLLMDRANRRAAREAMLKDWDVALEMNERFDQIHNEFNRLARQYDSLAKVVMRDFGQDTRDWRLNV